MTITPNITTDESPMNSAGFQLWNNEKAAMGGTGYAWNNRQKMNETESELSTSNLRQKIKSIIHPSEYYQNLS